MKKKKNTPYIMYPALYVEVNCRRDFGFKRSVRANYAITKDGQKLFIDATCKMHCHTETCTRCCNAVTDILNQVENGLREMPAILDPEEFLLSRHK